MWRQDEGELANCQSPATQHTSVTCVERVLAGTAHKVALLRVELVVLACPGRLRSLPADHLHSGTCMITPCQGFERPLQDEPFCNDIPGDDLYVCVLYSQTMRDSISHYPGWLLDVAQPMLPGWDNSYYCRRVDACMACLAMHGAVWHLSQCVRGAPYIPQQHVAVHDHWLVWYYASFKNLDCSLITWYSWGVSSFFHSSSDFFNGKLSISDVMRKISTSKVRAWRRQSMQQQSKTRHIPASINQCIIHARSVNM